MEEYNQMMDDYRQKSKDRIQRQLKYGLHLYCSCLPACLFVFLSVCLSVSAYLYLGSCTMLHTAGTQPYATDDVV